uniref:CA domain-containing protein n=1 Tax=Gongylonema pulchrum TaxID=637853 RepID=A0A183D886_9BILA
LKIEAEDQGTPKHSSETFVAINIEPDEAAVLPETEQTASVLPAVDDLQFSRRNYSASLSESVRPPHLLLVLPVLNKPSDKRFIICSIISGNKGGAFSILSGSDGNCELRTQMQLDRESTEHYHLNVSVKSEQELPDYATVEVTVLDANDNAPKFIYPNNGQLSNGYFAALAIGAPAHTHLVTVKAEDADAGNSSSVVYSLDPFSVDSKYFECGQSGEIFTKLSVVQMIEKSRKDSFEFRVSSSEKKLTTILRDVGPLRCRNIHLRSYKF